MVMKADEVRTARLPPLLARRAPPRHQSSFVKRISFSDSDSSQVRLLEGLLNQVLGVRAEGKRVKKK